MPRTLHATAGTAILLTFIVLSGCTDDDGTTDDEGAPPGGAPEYSLGLSGVPATVVAGEPFTITLSVTGAPTLASDHVGAHYGTSTSNEPSTTVYPSACPHQAGTLPGTFTVTCTVTSPGSIHLRGHARATEAGAQLDFWSSESVVIVEPAGYTLTVADLPANVTAGKNFTFTLTIAGGGPEESDHIGAHFGMSASTEPSTTVYPSACPHQSGTVPGVFMVTCSVAEPGTYHLRGHLRITKGDTQENYWSEERMLGVDPPAYTLTVSGVPATAVVAGQNFTFQLNVTGDAGWRSDHIGAHFGTNSSTSPSTTVYPQACAHQEGDLPGEFTVTCKITQAGTHYLRGHVRLTIGSGTYHYWSAEAEVTVAEVGY